MFKIAFQVFFAVMIMTVFSCEQNKEDRYSSAKLIDPDNSISEEISLKPEKIEKNFYKENQNALETNSTEAYTARIENNIGIMTSANTTDFVFLSHKPKVQVKEYFHSLSNSVPQGKPTPLVLNLIFDNDIFNNTDYYYTNGARIELTVPFAEKSLLNKALAGIKSAEIKLSGFSITQNIYTPINPDAADIQYNDRPFSAFLSIGQYRESYHTVKKLSTKSELSIGIVGPASLGSNVQSSIHDIEPVGWQNQVKNDFVLNYSFNIEKGMISNPGLELNIVGTVSAGTLFTNAGAGFYFRTGRFFPVYRGPLSSLNGSVKRMPVQFWFFARFNSSLVLYNATLQGGMFNQNNPYVISASSMKRAVINAGAGFAFYFSNFGIEYENNYLSPEFAGARHFYYGKIKIIAGF